MGKVTKYNAEGYYDPTFAAAANKDEESRKRSRIVISKIKDLLDENGFELIGRIKIRDKRTGDKYL